MPEMMLLALFLALSVNSKAQEKWSLSRCIVHALENNIDLTIGYNDLENSKINLRESKIALYPDLNLGSNVDYNLGRAIDGDNTVTFDPTLTNYYWVSSNFTIFQGMVKQNSIKYQNYLLQAKSEEIEIKKNQLITQILSSYYTVLYSKGLSDVAVSQLELSTRQYERMVRMVEVGKESPVTAEDLKSQMAEDQLSLTKAQNHLNKTLLELKQLLRLNATQPFEIEPFDSTAINNRSTYKTDELFAKATEVLPQLKQQALLLKLGEKDLSVARGQAYPSLNLIAGYSTAFYSNSELNYVKQLENNQNQWVGLSLRIPVFNRGEVSANIKRKKLALSSQQQQYEKQKEALYSEIWTAVDELESAEKEYESSQQLFQFSELNLKNMTKKLEKGLANTTEFQSAKQRMISAQANLLKAHMIYLMRTHLLEFYATGTWNHLE